MALFGLSMYDAVGDMWPRYLSYSILFWNVVVVAKAVSTGNFKGTHLPNLLAHGAMQSAPALMDLAHAQGWLSGRMMGELGSGIGSRSEMRGW